MITDTFVFINARFIEKKRIQDKQIPVFLKQLHNRLREMKLPDCEIHEFTSGRDLLSFYVKGMYEVIILDVEMPDLTGLQTAERIRHYFFPDELCRICR